MSWVSTPNVSQTKQLLNGNTGLHPSLCSSVATVITHTSDLLALMCDQGVHVLTASQRTLLVQLVMPYGIARKLKVNRWAEAASGEKDTREWTNVRVKGHKTEESGDVWRLWIKELRKQAWAQGRTASILVSRSIHTSNIPDDCKWQKDTATVCAHLTQQSAWGCLC